MSFDVEDFNHGAVEREAAGTRCALDLEVQIPDLDAFLDDPNLAAPLRGQLRPQLGSTFEGTGGKFQLFVPHPDARRCRIIYHLQLSDGHGRWITLDAFKLRRGPAPPQRLARHDAPARADPAGPWAHGLQGETDRHGHREHLGAAVRAHVRDDALAAAAIASAGPLAFQRGFLRRLWAVYADDENSTPRFDFPVPAGRG